MTDERNGKRGRSEAGFMDDDARATIGAGRRGLPSPAVGVPSPEIHSEDTPPPRAIDPVLQELIDRFWHLRKIDKEMDAVARANANQVLALSNDVVRLQEQVKAISKLEDAAAELERLSDAQERMSRELWGDEPRKPDEPALAKQARSGRRLLAILIGIVTTLGAAGAAGILVSIRKSGEAEGEDRAWRAQVNSQIHMLLSYVFRVDMGAAVPVRVDPLLAPSPTPSKD